MAEKSEAQETQGTYTRLEDLRGRPGAVRKRKRVGRGPGSGTGKTSGRGQKGQKSRSGAKSTVGFEGGQMPLQRRLPKRGFTNIFKKQYSEVNVGRLERFETGATLDADVLRASRLLRKISKDGVKLLGAGEIDRAFHFKVQGCSESARKKIEAAGGSVEIVPLRPAAKEEEETA